VLGEVAAVERIASGRTAGDVSRGAGDRQCDREGPAESEGDEDRRLPRALSPKVDLAPLDMPARCGFAFAGTRTVAVAGGWAERVGHRASAKRR